MTAEYSVEVCKKLQGHFAAELLHRPMRIERFDPGTELSYEANGVEPTGKGQIHLIVEKFVGGGFAGQVYQVRILDIEADEGPIGGLAAGNLYAMKILIPPSGLALMFRNVIYGIGFQGAFQLQSNPAAGRAGAIWQKFIRRGAKIRFGNENTVNDIHATFVDDKLGSCGELSDWVEGRTWKLEVDEHLDVLELWRKGKKVNQQLLGSCEYRAKHQFMHDFVKLLHDMGAHEFARQYEWSTCKSQPNCLKLRGTENDPLGGLIAVDFRAGLALLPFLPMSPGDFKLILNGIKRASLVQFDRGDLNKLEKFVQTHHEHFADMSEQFEELKTNENLYRNSVPDITHNHIRLFYDGKLWSRIFDSAVTGWKIRNLIDERSEKTLRKCKICTVVFLLLGLVPFFGKITRRIWGRKDWRQHYFDMLMSWNYLIRSVKARAAEKAMCWHRAGRMDTQNALKVITSPLRFLCHLPLSILPVGLHRFFTDAKFAKEKLHYLFIRPFMLYFKADLRKQWMRQMVSEGKKKHIITDEDGDVILSQLNEPYIQKYLISLVVHLLTLPVTQIVSIAIATVFYIKNPDMASAERAAKVAGILFLFQVIPISPGSISRGLYTLFMAIRDRSFKDYNIAIFLSFFKYIGYLAFPIQMAHHYPALARFMAGHWATDAVHFVPVFGERGALLEHWVFCLFYNWPLTIRRRLRKRAQMRSSIKPRYWHVGVCAIVGAAVFAVVDFVYLKDLGHLPPAGKVWWLSLLLPLCLGSVVTMGCGGANLWKRFVAATVCGVGIGVFYIVSVMFIGLRRGANIDGILKYWALIIFAYTVFSTIGAIIVELKLPDPDLR